MLATLYKLPCKVGQLFPNSPTPRFLVGKRLAEHQPNHLLDAFLSLRITPFDSGMNVIGVPLAQGFCQIPIQGLTCQHVIKLLLVLPADVADL